jgi:colicin import membrane protein
MNRRWSLLSDLAETARTGLNSLASQPRYLTYAVLVHLGFITLLIVSLQWSTVYQPAAPHVDIIQATLVDQAAIQRQIDRQREEARQAEDTRRREEQRLADVKRQQEQAAKQAEQTRREREAAAKAEQDKKQKEAAAKVEQERREKEAAAKAERERKEKEAAAAAKAEQERKAAAERAAQQTEINRYMTIIGQKVRRSWNMPDSWKKQEGCYVRVKIIPGGEVLDAHAEGNCGDAIAARSVESAVYKASPLPVPTGDNPLFEKFREFRLQFTGED